MEIEQLIPMLFEVKAIFCVSAHGDHTPARRREGAFSFGRRLHQEVFGLDIWN
jgi:hypothetical protein